MLTEPLPSARFLFPATTRDEVENGMVLGQDMRGRTAPVASSKGVILGDLAITVIVLVFFRAIVR
jgi:hypothetical protein